MKTLSSENHCPPDETNRKIQASTEADCLNSKGGLSNEDISKYVDFVSVAPNHYGLEWVEAPDISEMIDYSQEMLLNLAKRDDVRVILHPWIEAIARSQKSMEDVPLSYFEEFAGRAKKYGKVIEIHTGMDESCLPFIRTLIDHGVKLSIGSDAHSYESLGKTEKATHLAERLNTSDTSIWLPKQ